MAELTLEQQIGALDVALILDALVGRLTYDKDFADALAKDPRKALGDAGMVMEKAAMEEFVRTNPQRFDQVSDTLCSMLHEDFFASIGMSNSCD
ncbi:hypothetical protein LN042_35645 [Kitasatospora sp. RB6PN24]|uniref:hypothetical protein n=1 Tax=Kitasatospora humi TaxID=2893891 RepID=UPI001E4E3E1A|nr:hypothetical protein [Kitasatospora humi]MCC9312332.1 hypothetical protein [Kitasatospora humi]